MKVFSKKLEDGVCAPLTTGGIENLVKAIGMMISSVKELERDAQRCPVVFAQAMDGFYIFGLEEAGQGTSEENREEFFSLVRESISSMGEVSVIAMACSLGHIRPAPDQIKDLMTVSAMDEHNFSMMAEAPDGIERASEEVLGAVSNALGRMIVANVYEPYLKPLLTHTSTLH